MDHSLRTKIFDIVEDTLCTTSMGIVVNNNRTKMGPQKFHKNKKFDGKSTSKSKKKFKQFRVQPKKSLKEDDEIKELQSKYDSINVENITLFKDLPLSQKTIDGLKKSKYYKPTEIQRQGISYALQGRDVLGAAVTGSGKNENEKLKK